MAFRLAAFIAALTPLAAALAGPINPPAGPVASTYKTMTEVEPREVLSSANTPGDADSVFRISAPGSYYLGGNASAASGRAAVEIDASDVTLDLNGFWVRGAINTDTIRVVAGRDRITIRNGSMALPGEDGIDASGSTHVAVEDVTVAGAGLRGIVVGNHSQVRRCAVTGCGTAAASVGITTGESSVVAGCTADGNSSHGIDTDQGSTVSDCTASGNGARGIYHRGRGSITGCSALSNGQEGIRGENTVSVEGCTSAINMGRGIFLTLNANIRGCSTWQNGSDGIVVGNHSVVAHCNSTNNTGVGIQATSASSVLDCIASSNTSHGISVFGESIVARNNCTGNGFTTGAGSGIRTSTDNNRVEENNCSNNSIGIEVTGAGNIILRNTCAGNAGGNYSIVASNAVGTIINVAGAAVTSTNSFANFEY